MQTHVAQAGLPAFPAAGLDPEPPQSRNSPLEDLGPIAGEHVLLLGRGPLGLIDLLRAGASQAIHLRACERLEADSASLIIVQDIVSPSGLAAALPALRRALLPTGRLVLRLHPEPLMAESGIRRMLLLNGYTAARAIRNAAGLTIHAQRPAFGLRSVA